MVKNSERSLLLLSVPTSESHCGRWRCTLWAHLTSSTWRRLEEITTILQQDKMQRYAALSSTSIRLKPAPVSASYFVPAPPQMSSFASFSASFFTKSSNLPSLLSPCLSLVEADELPSSFFPLGRTLSLRDSFPLLVSGQACQRSCIPRKSQVLYPQACLWLVSDRGIAALVFGTPNDVFVRDPGTARGTTSYNNRLYLSTYNPDSIVIERHACLPTLQPVNVEYVPRSSAAPLVHHTKVAH